jgi:hypothetical protein
MNDEMPATHRNLIIIFYTWWLILSNRPGRINGYAEYWKQVLQARVFLKDKE